jgi:tetratricopeptide (TPR) repeat protein
MNRNLLLSILLLLTSWGAFAQEPSLRMKLANKKYDRLAYSAAIPLYQDVLKHEPGNLKAMVNLADSYQKVKDTRNAERLYGDIVKRNDAPKEAYLHYAQALAENNKYELPASGSCGTKRPAAPTSAVNASPGPTPRWATSLPTRCTTPFTTRRSTRATRNSGRRTTRAAWPLPRRGPAATA